MSIKPEAIASFFANQPVQKILASNLDEAFTVTHGAFRQGLAVWLCEPKPFVAERFGFQLEVAAIYSPHNRADARLISMARSVLDDELRDRVDRVVVLIIYEGEAAAVQALAEGEADRIFVPISAAELRSKARGAFFVRSKIAERVGQFDLFGMSSPITHDKYFYGRKQLVQELLVRATAKREHSGLFGLRKTGKTSVLFAIQRRLAGTTTHCEYIDCQSPGIYGGRWWLVLEEIAIRLVDSARRANDALELSLGNFSSSSAANDFNRIVKSIFESGTFSHLVLFLDEIEFLTPEVSNNLGKHWDFDFQPFWQTIRSVSQETGGALTFIAAGVNPSTVDQPSFSGLQNPIFQLAVPYFLEPLSLESIRDMVRTIGRYSGVGFTEDCYAYLQSNYGGHPYLIRLACSETLKGKGNVAVDSRITVTVNDFDAARDQIRARLTKPIKDILLSLVWWYPEEYELLRVLAEDEDIGKAFIIDSPEMAALFARYGLVSWPEFRFSIADMQSFLVQEGEAYKAVISPFKRGDLPPEALPDVPDIENLAKLFELRTEVEVSLRKLLVMLLGYSYAFDDVEISKHIVKGLSRKESAQLFVGRRPQDAIHELYLSDLAPVYAHNWKLFTAYFGQSSDRFRMNIDTINIARRFDSHSKPISEEEMSDFQNSYEWFASRLRKVPGLNDNVSGS